MTNRRGTKPPLSLRRQLSRRNIIGFLRARGVPMPYTARVYLHWGTSVVGTNIEIDIDDDHPITVSTKGYDRKDRR